MAGIVVVFDFDKTIIECDSDNWLIDELGFTEMFDELLPTMPWNPLMDKMMKEVHSKGVTINDIIDVLKRTPMHPRMIPTIRSAHAAGCELRIVSDANQFYIETILQHHELRDYFSEIHTNPGYVDEEEGRLRIFPHHDYARSSHGCKNVCPPNMCKSQVVQKMVADEGTKKFIYLGDGAGDYCPMLKFRGRDCVMPRKNFPVWDLISSNPSLIAAEIHEWTDGEDLEPTLLRLIIDSIVMINRDGPQHDINHTAVSAAAAQLMNSDSYKFESVVVPPTSSQETLPQALSVPH